MTVLVTGGAGYIGSHTVRQLCESGADVVVLDDLSTGHERAVAASPGARLVVGDIADAALVDEIARRYQVDAVIHFAAFKAPGESMADPGRYFTNNVSGSISLVDALVRAGVRRMVFSSSCAVYGTPGDLPVTEDHPTSPASPYGESKLAVERLLHWYDVCHGLRSVALRYFNAAGAAEDASLGEDWSRTTNLVPLAMRAALNLGPRLRIFGTDYPTPDGTAVRDYVHVLDLADAHVRALEYLDARGTSVTLNLGTGLGTSVAEIISTMADETGVEVPHDYADRRPGDPAAVFADYRKALAVLGWRPRRPLDEILSSAWRWHSTHPFGHGTGSALAG